MNIRKPVPIPEWQQHPADGFLNTEEVTQLDRIMDRLLPEDPIRQIPGALRAGASQYVSLLLAKTVATYVEIPDWQKLYRSSLQLLNNWSIATYSTPLALLDEMKIDDLIRGLEAGNLINVALSPSQQQILFKTFLRHMQQGCFGDPRWGGNKDKIMWRAMGYLQQPETAIQIQCNVLRLIPL